MVTEEDSTYLGLDFSTQQVSYKVINEKYLIFKILIRLIPNVIGLSVC